MPITTCRSQSHYAGDGTPQGNLLTELDNLENELDRLENLLGLYAEISAEIPHSETIGLSAERVWGTFHTLLQMTTAIKAHPAIRLARQGGAQ